MPRPNGPDNDGTPVPPTSHVVPCGLPCPVSASHRPSGVQEGRYSGSRARRGICMLSRGRRPAACPQGGGARQRSHFHMLGFNVSEARSSNLFQAKLTVYVGARGERGVLGERVGNIVIGSVGILIGLFGIVVILGESACTMESREPLHTLVSTEYSQLSVRWGTAMTGDWRVEELKSRCPPHRFPLPRNILGVILAHPCDADAANLNKSVRSELLSVYREFEIFYTEGPACQRCVQVHVDACLSEVSRRSSCPACKT